MGMASAHGLAKQSEISEPKGGTMKKSVVPALLFSFATSTLAFAQEPQQRITQYFGARNIQFGSRDPRVNGSLNPQINGSINPEINGSINPRINGSINPHINGSISPRINGTLNPRINGSINPRINGTLNPRINSSINPTVSTNLYGYYLWNRSNQSVGMLVAAPESCFVWFAGTEWRGYAVPNGEGGYNMFTTDGSWIDYLISNSAGGYNVFDLQNQWIGFTT
jgi:hypothetical protein